MRKLVGERDMTSAKVMNNAAGVVVITGAGRGIGRACALEFAARGQICALLGRRSAHMTATLSECMSSAPDSFFVECDLTDLQAIETAAATVLERPTPIAL